MMLFDLLDLASPKATYALLYLLKAGQHLHWAFFFKQVCIVLLSLIAKRVLTNM